MTSARRASAPKSYDRHIGDLELLDYRMHEGQELVAKIKGSSFSPIKGHGDFPMRKTQPA